MGSRKHEEKRQNKDALLNGGQNKCPTILKFKSRPPIYCDSALFVSNFITSHFLCIGTLGQVFLTPKSDSPKIHCVQYWL